MNYREQLIKAIKDLEEAKSAVFNKIINVAMSGELKELNSVFEIGDGYEFELSQFEDLSDTNVQHLIGVYKNIDKTVSTLININAIKEKELESDVLVGETPNIKKQHCPLCRDDVQYSERYPKYVCSNCAEKITDADGRNVNFFNLDLYGGIGGEYVDTGEAYNKQVCYIDGVKCYAEEGRFGGIVVQVKSTDSRWLNRGEKDRFQEME